MCHHRPSGRAVRHQADQFVLAIGGLEVTRLLLLSGALGDNARGDLGRHFMVHPLIRCAALAEFTEEFHPRLQSFYDGSARVAREPAAANESAPRFRAPVYDARFEGAEPGSFTVWGALAPTAQVLAEKRIGNFRVNLGFDRLDRKRVQVNINWEQVAQPGSRITLHPTQKDPVFRQPVLQLDWHLIAIDKATVIEALSLCKAFFGKLEENRLRTFTIETDLSGGPEQWTFDPDGEEDRALWPGDHHLGTARMSKDPKDGIVDPNLKVHSVDNLYLASCAVFPTGGYANSTLTLLALAIRLADHLRNQLGAVT